jgi:DNA processing protein
VLDAGGSTIAVMGTGLDRVYPASHRELAHRIAESGALVSELSPGTPALAQNFPRRNRIISGLSLGVVVVEAAQRSGSLITARCALEQGRDVFAIPGSIHNPLSRGCHELIRNGAKLVETAEHILEELGALALGEITGKQTTENTDINTLQMDEEYQLLLEKMGYDPVSVDELISISGLTPEQLSSMLLLLELEGYVSSSHGGRYARTRKESLT